MPCRSHGRRIETTHLERFQDWCIRSHYTSYKHSGIVPAENKAGAPQQGKARRWPRPSCSRCASLLLLVDWLPHLVLWIWLHRPAFGTGKLVGQSIGVVDLAQRLDDRPRVHLDRARHLVAVLEVPRQRLDVSVEDDPHHLGVLSDDWAARVTADNVGCGNRIERCVEVNR